MVAAPGGAVLQENLYDAIEVFNSALLLIREQYLEPVDASFLMDGAVRGIFEALDADSAYLSAEDLGRHRNVGSAGIGVGLQKRYYLHVDDVLPGSPAADAGLERGVAITSINGQNTRELRIPLGRALLAGPPGSTVELGLRDTGDATSRVVTLERRVPAPHPVEFVLEEPGGVGMVRIRRFHEETPSQLAGAIGEMQRDGLAGLVLDLRGSRAQTAGCEAGVEAAAVFMTGAVAELVTRDAAGDESASPLATPPGDPLFEGPLAVAVNASTVCPAEVLAAALRSREETDIVGRRTAGRTGRPEVIEFPGGDAILLSTAHIRGTDGEDILGVGVAPTLLPSDLGIEPDELGTARPELEMAFLAMDRRLAEEDPG